MISDPALCEPVEFIELGFRIAFGRVFHFDPVDQGHLYRFSGEVWMELLDSLDGLRQVEAFCVRPDHFALSGIEMDAFH